MEDTRLIGDRTRRRPRPPRFSGTRVPTVCGEQLVDRDYCLRVAQHEAQQPVPLYRITTVCLGNICRSPIAEVVLADRIRRAGLSDRVLVDSAGTGDWHVGGQADRRTIAVLTQRGYQINHVPRQITSHWFTDINLLLAMDSANFTDLQRMSQSRPGASGTTSLRMLRSFDPDLDHLKEPHPDLDVPDPYYGNPEDFDLVLALVERAADGVVNYVQLDLSR